MKNYQQIIYQVSQADLQEFAMTLITQTKKELEAEIVASKTERYLSSSEVTEILRVDPSTLWRWSKRSYLVPISIGGKKRYKYSDIKNLLEGENKND